MKKIKFLISSFMLASALLCSAPSIAAEPEKPAMAQAQTQTNQMAQVESDKLNINSASAAEIQKALIGIGAKKAEAIVQYREKHGNFTAPEQLLEVQGIGKATLEKNLSRLAF